jgi:tetratricopeptide (TPR) repeat protein
MSKGDYAKAIQLYEQLIPQTEHPAALTLLTELSVRQNAVGKEHPATVAILEELGQMYFSKGHMDEAEDTYQEVATILKAKLKK